MHGREPTLFQRIALAAVTAYKRGGQVVAKLGSFYAGYRILHHEVYETDTAEITLVVLGLWLCGIAPATFIDSLRKAATEAQSIVDEASSKLESGAEHDHPEHHDPATEGSG